MIELAIAACSMLAGLGMGWVCGKGYGRDEGFRAGIKVAKGGPSSCRAVPLEPSGWGVNGPEPAGRRRPMPPPPPPPLQPQMVVKSPYPNWLKRTAR